MLRFQPSLRTTRFLLRPFLAEDAADLQKLAGAWEIADTMISIPHPYSLAYAKSWIAGLSHFFRSGTGIDFAIVLRESKELIGSVALRDIDHENEQAELGFWIGVSWSGAGYATEAAREVTRFGFDHLSLNRIYAHYMVRNLAAGAVLLKLGMKQEGLLRQRVRKWGAFEDVALSALLRDDVGAT